MRPLLKMAAIVVPGVAGGLVLFALFCKYTIRASRDESARELPGDNLIAKPFGSITDAITIPRPARDVWPWLVQMGAGRAGWYAYDWIDNGGRPSASRILPEFQDITVGAIFPAVPGSTDAFAVEQFDAEQNLVLAWKSPRGEYLTTWAFVLEPSGASTRILVRGRIGPNYRPYGLPLWLAKLIAPLTHSIMERRQLSGIAHRVRQ